MNDELILKANQFDKIISIINQARSRALKAVNAELIRMYWVNISRACALRRNLAIR